MYIDSINEVSSFYNVYSSLEEGPEWNALLPKNNSVEVFSHIQDLIEKQAYEVKSIWIKSNDTSLNTIKKHFNIYSDKPYQNILAYPLNLNINFIKSDVKLRFVVVFNQKEANDFKEIFKKAFDANDTYMNTLWNRVPNFKDNSTRLVVGYNNNIPVVIGGVFFYKDISTIHSVGTLESERNKGYATSICKYIITLCPTNKILIEPENEKAQSIYIKLGFVEIGSYKILTKK